MERLHSERILVAVSAALLLLFTTTPSEMVWAFSKFRLPSAAGLAFTAALRFLARMLERMTVLLQVVQVRGYDLTLPRWWQVWYFPSYLWRVFAVIPVITIPLLIDPLRTTSVMAMVVDARGFGSQCNNRHMLKEHRATWREVIAWLVLVALAFAVLLLTISHIGARNI
ncbi:MAG: energy-coupling factor transporter transmembrane component T family protein [Ktedonobacterales bacterium]